MNKKNDLEVFINGKQYTLSGYESQDYMQHIANHINEKYAQFKEQEGYSRLDTDMKNVLMEINLSDDYFKAKDQVRELQEQKEEDYKEIFDIKQELIKKTEQVKKLEKQLNQAKIACEEAKHQTIRLEAELKSVTRKPSGSTTEK